MAGRRVFHLVRNEGRWVLKEEGSSEILLSRYTKVLALAEAIPRLRRTPGNTQLKIHKVDGTFQEERTYGDDPERYEG